MNGATSEGNFLTVADPRAIGIDLTSSVLDLGNCDAGGGAMIAPRGDDNYLDVEDRFDRLPSLRWSEFERFLNNGVPARALVYPELPARARVTLFPDRPLFDFAEDVDEDGAVPAFIFLARDEFGDACDLVAWAPGQARVAAWLGRASMLGLESLWAPRIAYDGALVVHETPREWLQSERQGVVVIEPQRAAPLLREAEHLCVSNAEYGFSLRSLLASRPPRIVVPKASLRRAA